MKIVRICVEGFFIICSVYFLFSIIYDIIEVYKYLPINYNYPIIDTNSQTLYFKSVIYLIFIVFCMGANFIEISLSRNEFQKSFQVISIILIGLAILFFLYCFTAVKDEVNPKGLIHKRNIAVSIAFYTLTLVSYSILILNKYTNWRKH